MNVAVVLVWIDRTERFDRIKRSTYQADLEGAGKQDLEELVRAAAAAAGAAYSIRRHGRRTRIIRKENYGWDHDQWGRRIRRMCLP